MERAGQRLSLPPEAMAAVPLVHLHGSTTVCIENHGGILEYTSESIRVRVKGGGLLVRGCGLHISRMTRRCLEICGTVQGVELL